MGSITERDRHGEMIARVWEGCHANCLVAHGYATAQNFPISSSMT